MKKPSIKISLLLLAALISIVCSYIITLSTTEAPEATYILLNGTKLKTNDFKGQVTLVHFWATSCATCVDEMPQLIQIHTKFHTKNFNTIAVAMKYDPPSYVNNFTNTRNLPFLVAIDSSGSVAKAWGNINITPTSFLINRNGDVVKQYIGRINVNELSDSIQQLL